MFTRQALVNITTLLFLYGTSFSISLILIFFWIHASCCTKFMKSRKTSFLVLPCKCHYWHKNLYCGISLGSPLSAFPFCRVTSDVAMLLLLYKHAAITFAAVNKQHYRSTSTFTLHIITIISPKLRVNHNMTILF